MKPRVTINLSIKDAEDLADLLESIATKQHLRWRIIKSINNKKEKIQELQK